MRRIPPRAVQIVCYTVIFAMSIYSVVWLAKRKRPTRHNQVIAKLERLAEIMPAEAAFAFHAYERRLDDFYCIQYVFAPRKITGELRGKDWLLTDRPLREEKIPRSFVLVAAEDEYCLYRSGK